MIPSIVFLGVLELTLAHSSLAPHEMTWESQSYSSIESYYAQAPQHFEPSTDSAFCQSASHMTRGYSSTRKAMQPQQFLCQPKGQRIVTLGGSSIQGYGVPFSQTIASRLQAELQAINANTDVVNAGVAGYNSLQIKRMMPEIWALKPDILILYAGHNDYVFYPVIEQLLNDHPSYHLLRQAGQKSAIWRALRALMYRLNWFTVPSALPKAPEVPDFDQQAKAAFNQIALPKTTRVQALSQLQQSQKLAETTIFQLFKKNISDISEQARQRNCKLLLIAPISRLDSPPVDGIIWNRLTQEELNAFWELWSDLDKSPPPYSDPRWQQALKLAPHYAPLAHAYAQAAYQENDLDTAIHYWRIAQDYAPPTRSIRAGNPMADWMLEIGRELKIPTIDPRQPFQQAAHIKGVPAGTLFLDALHFTEKGSALITALSLERMQKEAWISKPNSLD